MTAFMLTPVFPAVYASLLMIALAFMRFQKDLISPNLAEATLIVILGVLLGYCLIAVALPFIGGPVPLT